MALAASAFAIFAWSPLPAQTGSHLTLALLAYRAPELVEIGIATDAVFAVIILVLLAGQIYNQLHTLDSAELQTLKG